MVLEIDNIELNFDKKRILSGIYVKAQKGEVTGILGRNGSGKTSLFNIIQGNLKPKYKSIRIDGKNQKRKLYLSNHVGYLPQHSLLPKGLKISKAFALFNVDWGVFTQVFETFKIYKNHNVSKLSTGEIRLIETFLVLHMKKDILLLDEPFSFIAPVYVERIKALILAKKDESIILISDHFYRDILEVSDKIYLLKAGCSKLVENEQDLANNGYLSPSSRQR
ncbi:MAG: ATP-binding cassette domain-containing protein [Allomuricauda sp.]